MKLRNIAAALGSLALLGTLGLAGSAQAAPHTPPPPLTTRNILPAEGNQNCVDVNQYPGIGSQLGSASCESISGGWQEQWVFQIISGETYMIHPDWSNSQCVTLSTTQLGVSKIESCVGSTGSFNQQFLDFETPHGYYHISSNNGVGNVYLNDAHDANPAQHTLGTIQTCPEAFNGCTMLQSS